MSTLTYWIKGLMIDTAQLSLFGVWQIWGVDQAGDVFLFWVWLLIVIRMLASWVVDKTTFKAKRPMGFKEYRFMVEPIVISCLVWSNYPAVAALYFLAFLMIEAAREREPESKGV